MDRFTVRVELVGGPQDGGKVVMYTDDIKPAVWVGPKWMGDGAAAFTTDGPCERFPAGYRYSERAYHFTGFDK